MRTWVQHAGGHNDSPGGTTSLSITSATAVSVGDAMCAAATWDSGAGATSGVVTDSLGNTWVPGLVKIGANNQPVQVFACVVTHPGTPVATLQFGPTPGTTAAAGVEFLLDVFTGSTSTAAVDGTGASNEQTAGAGSDNVSSGNLVTSNDECLIYSATVNQSTGGGTQTPGTGFSAGTSDANTIAFNTEWAKQATHGTIAATWNTNAVGDSFVTVAMAIAPTTGGGPTTVTPTGLGLTASVGSPVITLSAVQLSPSGLGLAASVGGPSVHTNANTTIGPTGFGLTASVGTPSTSSNANDTITPTGYGLTTSLGVFTIEVDTTIIPGGMLLTSFVGTPALNIVNGGGNATVTPLGFGLVVSLGSESISTTSLQTPVGLGLSASVGAPAISRGGIVAPPGLGLIASIGIPFAGQTDRVVHPAGMGLLARLGAPALQGVTSSGGAKHHSFRFGFSHSF